MTPRPPTASPRRWGDDVGPSVPTQRPVVVRGCARGHAEPIGELRPRVRPVRHRSLCRHPGGARRDRTRLRPEPRRDADPGRRRRHRSRPRGVLHVAGDGDRVARGRRRAHARRPHHVDAARRRRRWTDHTPCRVQLGHADRADRRRAHDELRRRELQRPRRVAGSDRRRRPHRHHRRRQRRVAHVSSHRLPGPVRESRTHGR